MTAQTQLKQIGRIFIQGVLESRTGMHIGGTEVGLQIGGADSSVIRNGIDGVPYIPGSSLKGKMRSLLERIYTPGELKAVGKSRIYMPEQIEEYRDPEKGFIFHLFGITPETVKRLKGNENEEIQALPTRLIIRDASMTQKSKDLLNRSLYTDMPYTQVKTEVVIDRITSAATPRQIERVPAGAQFNFEMVFNLYFETDLTFLERISEAMELLEYDSLGGHGSRGYGQVRFVKRSADATWFNGVNYDTQVNEWKNGFERDENGGNV
ncbi:MAG: type III-A CRISPR-associated RAMP protein Csm3 [Candidatus Hydrogenedentes bacterium]|nr:type III-A CRISPR-associated RAMP protein Csm3 [Candidatus Hydrogenedentota bacterium]